MHESLDRDSSRRYSLRTPNETLSFRRGEEAFRARGEGLWENEATGEAHEILSIVQEARPFAPRTPSANYAMFAKSVGNTPQGHAR